jgi:predicted dehydrogenase
MNEDVTRRGFLKEVAAAAAAFSLGMNETLLAQAGSKPGAPEPTKPLPVTVAVIGTGNEGRDALMANARRIPGVNIVAVADINPQNLDKGVKMTKGTARGYEDYRKMLEQEKEVQAVLIATPLNTHSPMTVDCLNAGKHVLCEKTMAYSVEDGKKMIQAAKRNKRWLQIGHQRRYNPVYYHAYDLIQKGTIGRITHVRSQWNRNGNWKRAVPKNPPQIALKKWGYKDVEHLVNWRLYKDHSQGLMAELGSHQLDAVNWMLGATPTAVMGMGGIDYWKDGREVYDNVNVIYEYPNGVKVFYQSLTTNSYDDYYEMFMGEKGTLILQGESKGFVFPEPNRAEEWMKLSQSKMKGGQTGREGVMLDASATVRSDKPKVAGQDIDIAKVRKSPYQLELEAFFRCVLENQKPFCDGETALAAAATILLANEAMDKGTKLVFSKGMMTV